MRPSGAVRRISSAATSSVAKCVCCRHSASSAGCSSIGRSVVDSRENSYSSPSTTTHLDVALADPEVAVLAADVGRRAPVERRVLVEESRMGGAHDAARVGLHHVRDEEAHVVVLADVGEVVGRVEELELVLRRVAEREQPRRALLRLAGGEQLHAAVEQAPELARDLRRASAPRSAGSRRCASGSTS